MLYAPQEQYVSYKAAHKGRLTAATNGNKAQRSNKAGHPLQFSNQGRLAGLAAQAMRYGNAAPELILPKLAVSQPADRHEREAERISEQIIRPDHSHLSGGSRGVRSPQRVTSQPYDGIIPGGRKMPAYLRTDFEPRFQQDFSEVRIHADTVSNRMAAHIQARAFAIGRHILFGAGQYAPHSKAGRKLIAHELVHVVQQRLARTPDSTGNTPDNKWQRSPRDSVAIPEVETPVSDREISRAALRINVSGRERQEQEPSAWEAANNAPGLFLAADSFGDLLDGVERLVGEDDCLASLYVFNHASPQGQVLGEEHRIHGIGGPPLRVTAVFDTQWLIKLLGNPKTGINRLRILFCCRQPAMYWLGCANAGVLAYQGRPRESEIATCIDRYGVEACQRRYGEHQHWYQEISDAAANEANVLSATVGRTNMQNWANATCAKVIGTTDMVVFTPEQAPFFELRYGGTLEPVRPEPHCPCSDGRIAAIQRPGAEAQAALRSQLQRSCDISESGLIRASVVYAEESVDQVIAALQDTLSIWGDQPTTRRQRATARALTQVFSVMPYADELRLLGIDEEEIRQRTDIGVANRVLEVLEEIERRLPLFRDVGACAADVEQCVMCHEAQHPMCPSGARAFVQFRGGTFTGRLNVCPGFFRLNNTRRGQSIVHEMAHLAGARDVVQGYAWYGCPIQPRRYRPEKPYPELNSMQRARIAQSYGCFVTMLTESLRSAERAALRERYLLAPLHVAEGEETDL